MRTPHIALILALLAFPMAVAAAPLGGRWEGVFHGGRGDQAVTLICRPGTDGALGGLLYMGGDLMGPIENGRVRGDSLHFNVMNFLFAARRNGEQMTLDLIIANGRTHEMALRFASADTSRLVPSPEALAAARARTEAAWDQVPDSVFAAHKVAADAAPGVPARLRAGYLFLVGGGPSQDDLNAEFLKLAGGAAAKIVVIPTASVNPGEDAEALGRGDGWARSLGVDHVTVLHTPSRAEADDEAFVRPLRQATGVWLPGGEAGRILVSYLGTRTERELMALLARGGVIGGTSAGALVWGSECQTFRAPADGSPFQMGDANALLVDDPHRFCFGALVNVLVAPHFTEFRMQPSLIKTLAARPQILGLGIDEATALEIHGSVASVLGRGRVTIFDGKDHDGARALVLRSGARYDLGRKAPL
jgi:cyanophycinase